MPSTGAFPERPRAMILVEGSSDQQAVRAVADRRGDDLAARRIAVIAMQGVTNIGHYLRRYGPDGCGVPLAGLCDAGEADYVGRALMRGGLCADPSRKAMQHRGFFVCTRDLEDELIRAVGVDRVLSVIAGEGELRSLRTLQHQPAQRGRSAADQLRRFFGARAGNKHRYARLLAGALDPAQVPAPLAGVLDHVTATLRRETHAVPLGPARG